MPLTARRILLLAPPNGFLTHPWASPRLGLLAVATLLAEQGHEVRLRHLEHLTGLPGLLSAGVDLVGIAATSREYPDALAILNACKRWQPRLPVMIGGPHATALPEECLRNGFDWVIAGEAEEVIADLVAQAPATPTLLRPAPVADLDRLPIPDRRLLDAPERWQPNLDAEVGPATPIELSRGCPYHCAFCGPHDRYRRRGAPRIDRELATLAGLGYRALVVLDDLPFLTLEQVRDFCAAARQHDLAFRCNLRANLITPAMAQELARSGCRRVQIGVESAADAILAGVGKGLRAQATGAAVRLCQDAGIRVKAMFVWGLPGDGPATARAIHDWVRHYRPESIQVSSFVPLPGSPLWATYGPRVVDYRDLNFFEDGDAVMGVGNDRHTAAELAQWRRWLLAACQDLTTLDRGLPNHHPTSPNLESCP